MCEGSGFATPVPVNLNSEDTAIPLNQAFSYTIKADTKSVSVTITVPQTGATYSASLPLSSLGPFTNNPVYFKVGAYPQAAYPGTQLTGNLAKYISTSTAYGQVTVTAISISH